MEKSVKTPMKLTAWKAKCQQRRIKRRQQADILRYIGELYTEGFMLGEILLFLKILEPHYQEKFMKMQETMSQGGLFYEQAHHLNLNANIRYQIYIAETKGNLGEGLLQIANYLDEQDRYEKKLRQALAYPLLLIAMVIGLLLALRFLMLPHLKTFIQPGQDLTTDWLLTSLEHFPQALVLALAGLSVLLTLFYRWCRRTKALKRAQTFVKIPFLGSLFLYYYTYFFAYEFSQLLKLGYSFKEIVATFRQQNISPLLQELGEFLNQGYIHGVPFQSKLQEARIFSPECQAIVAHGEQISALGIKLHLYSQRCQKALFKTLARQTNYLKNIIFLAIATLIISVYLILMLPMLSMLGGLQA